MSWAPFNSVISGNTIIEELEIKRKKVKKPVLSEDQLNIINTNLLEAYQNKITVEMKFYLNSYIYKLRGIITNINYLKKELTINKKIIHFSQIISLKLTS